MWKCKEWAFELIFHCPMYCSYRKHRGAFLGKNEGYIKMCPNVGVRKLTAHCEPWYIHDKNGVTSWNLTKLEKMKKTTAHNLPDVLNLGLFYKNLLVNNAYAPFCYTYCLENVCGVQSAVMIVNRDPRMCQLNFDCYYAFCSCLHSQSGEQASRSSF